MEHQKNRARLSEEGPVIFALDTSSKTTSMVLARGERVVASFGAELDDRRSARLWTEIEFLLNEVGLTINEVDLFSVCVGPGGFTGVRVGMAAIKGFAAATGKQVVGVTSLEAAALSAWPLQPVAAVMNAYRGEFYSQLFSFDADAIPVARNVATVSTISQALERMPGTGNLSITGDAFADKAGLAAQYKGEVGAEASAIFSDREWVVTESPRFLAAQVARLAYKRFCRGETVGPEALQACYVRQSEAEIKLSLGLLNPKSKRVVKTQ